MSKVIVIANNIRSTYNIGSIFRTSDGMGVKQLILTGYTPYPAIENDKRLPHLVAKLTRQIQKSSLGAEQHLPFAHHDSAADVIDNLKKKGYRIVALEQHASSTQLNEYTPPGKIALLLGEEVSGINPALLDMCDDIIEIPMVGSKESFNVSVACGIALYALTNCSATDA